MVSERAKLDFHASQGSATSQLPPVSNSSGSAHSDTSAPADAEALAALMAAWEPHREFSKIFQDAFALVDASGRVIKHNQMFCQLCGVKAFELRRSPRVLDLLEDQSPTGELPRMLSKAEHQRIDEVPLRQSRSGSTLQVIITSFPFLDSEGNHLGSCLLLRDVTAETQLQGKYTERTLESITDPLTGLFSRRYLERLMVQPDADTASPQAEAAQDVGNHSILMCDIDHFKRINDTYGHLGGDSVLKAVAQEIQRCCRQTDRVARYGGEEFAVVLAETPIEGACRVAEKIRQAVAGLRISFEGHEISLTISIGGTECFAASETMTDVLARADAHLYKAKTSGRNCALIAKRDGSVVVSDAHGTWRPFGDKAA